MILIDTNSLIILVLGVMDPKLISSHKRTSIYEEKNFRDLLLKIGSFDNLITLPNVWTETDNLLNRFKKNQRWSYYQSLKQLVSETSEKYIPSSKALENDLFIELGQTDTLLLTLALECELLITGDSKLSDYARAYGIQVYDVVANRNGRL